MDIVIEDPVGFQLEMGEVRDLATRVWDLLRTNQKHDVPIWMPYLNSYELPFYHFIGVRNDIAEPSMNLQCSEIKELFSFTKTVGA